MYDLTRVKQGWVWGTFAFAAILFFINAVLNGFAWERVTTYLIVLSVPGLLYELFRWLQACSRLYQRAFMVWLLGLLLLIWVSGAVGIIGSENNPANLLYMAVFVTGLLGGLLVRFQSLGMVWVLGLSAAVQFLVPVYALFIWPAQVSWGDAGVIGVIVFNSFFAAIFAFSAWLLKKAAMNSTSGEKA